MERGQWGRAETMLSKAVQTCPIDSDARRQYAETLWHRGDKPAAIKQLEEARKLSNEDPALAVRLGELYLESGQVQLARDAADAALQIDPKSAAAWALHARSMTAVGEPRQALADYQRSLGYEPDKQDVLLGVAEAYRQLNQPDRALCVLQTLTETYPPGEQPRQVLYLEGLALTALGRYDDAAQSFAAASTRERPTAEILYRLAEAEMLAGRPVSSQASAQQALALDPAHACSRALLDQLRVARELPSPAGRGIIRK